MNLPKPHISAEHSSRRHYQPVICLLLWAIALNGNPARELLSALGVEQAEVDGMMDGMEPELAEMRRLRIVSELFDRERIGQLLRARFAEMLMQVHRPGELAQLAKAAQRMPAWAFDGNAEPAHNNKRAHTGARTQAHTPAHHAQARAGEHNGALHVATPHPAPDSGLISEPTPVIDKISVEDVDEEFPLGVKENGEAYTAVELVGELNGMLDEIKRLDDAKAMIDGFKGRDLMKELEGFQVPIDATAALEGPGAVEAAGDDESV